MMFCQSYSNILMKLRQPAIFEPNDIWKSYNLNRKPKMYSQTCNSIQGFLLRYVTLPYVIWLKNGRLSKFDENIGLWLVKHYDLYYFFKVVYICILYLKITINLQQITYFIVVKLPFLHNL